LFTPQPKASNSLLLNKWSHIGQALVGSISALVFIFALASVAKHHLPGARVPGHQDPALIVM